MLGDFNLCLFGTDALGSCLPPPPKATPSPFAPYIGVAVMVAVAGAIAFALRPSKGKS